MLSANLKINNYDIIEIEPIPSLTTVLISISRLYYKNDPKNNNMYFPAKNEISNIINTFKDVQNAILFRSKLLLSSVKPTNTGTVPKGFITKNNAAKISINNPIFFIAKISVFDFF